MHRYADEYERKLNWVNCSFKLAAQLPTQNTLLTLGNVECFWSILKLIFAVSQCEIHQEKEHCADGHHGPRLTSYCRICNMCLCVCLGSTKQHLSCRLCELELIFHCLLFHEATKTVAVKPTRLLTFTR